MCEVWLAHGFLAMVVEVAERTFDVLIFDTIFVSPKRYLRCNCEALGFAKSERRRFNVPWLFEKIQRFKGCHVSSFYDAEDAEYVLSLAGDTESLSIEVEVGESAS